MTLRILIVVMSLSVEVGFSTIVDDMEIGANTLHDIGALFLWDVRLGKNHGEMSFDESQAWCDALLGRVLVIVAFMFHGGVGACVDARVDDPGFEDSNPRMKM